MEKPPASFSDHGWRAIAMCGSRWMVAARYEDAVTVEDGVITKTWDAEKHAKLFAAAPKLLAMLIRYRNETPLGHQPHMIAHEADALIAEALGSDLPTSTQEAP
jgi:hypothetical protein